MLVHQAIGGDCNCTFDKNYMTKFPLTACRGRESIISVTCGQSPDQPFIRSITLLYPPSPYWIQRLMRLMVAVLIFTSPTICS